MKCKVLIIGAGASGRGYIARLLKMDGVQLAFMDIRRELVEKLRNSGKYHIYVGKEHLPVVMESYETFDADDEAAVRFAAEADYVFVSVGEQNLPALSSFFKARAAFGGCCRIVVCENGIAPKLVMRKALEAIEGCSFQVTQAVIFCTTIPFHEIDILSEDYNEMLYDADDGLFQLPFPHFPPQKRFDILLKRKIYTYNCLSACIAYTGYLKGYTDYAKAANDPAIKRLCEKLCGQLTKVISGTYHVPVDEQERFGQNALRKFTDSTISDTIYKNARTAIRKLSGNERLLGPMELFLNMNVNTDILCFLTACAMVYLRREEVDSMLSEGSFRPIDLLLHFNKWLPGDEAVQILHDYEALQQADGIDGMIDELTKD